MTEAVHVRQRVEHLLQGVVERPREEWSRRVAELCAQQPELADALHRRFEIVARLLELAPDALASSGEHFGEFELLEQLGGGGMGVVYRARQRRGDLDRVVALKLVRHRRRSSDGARERFRREARAAMRLDHPAICPVYDAGEIDGTPYLAMRVVEGETLARKIESARAADREIQLASDSEGPSETPTSPTSSKRGSGAVVALIETVARALHVAHEAGLIHRDVKPGNIMVTPVGDPVLLDFGLVRDETGGDSSSLTLSGQPIGTPAYMSPEQVAGAAGAIDRRSDVYALGAVLYECLTLRPPFEGTNRAALYAEILRGEPRRIRRLNPAVPKDLAIVVTKALDRDPARRYQSALAFAEDLRRVRELRPIEARATGTALRTWLWCRRNPLIAGFVALLVVGSSVLAWQAVHLDRAHDTAVENLRETTATVEALVRTARFSLSSVAGSEAAREELLERALAFHERVLARDGDDPDVRRELALALLLEGELRIALSQTAAARASLERAESELGKVRAHAPDSPEVGYLLARCWADQVYALERPDDTSGGLARLDRAVAFLESIDRISRTAKHHALLAECLFRRAQIWWAAGELRRAVADCESAVDVFEVLSADPEPAVSPLELCKAIGFLGTLHTTLQQYGEAERCFARAMRVTEALPPTARAREQLASLCEKHAHLHKTLVRFDAAEDSYATALAIYRQLAADSPDARRHTEGVARCRAALGVVEGALGRAAEAERQLAAAIDVFEALAGDAPDSIELQYRVGKTTFELARQCHERDPGEAALLYERVVDRIAPVVEAYPTMVSMRDLLGRSFNNWGVILWRSGQRDRATELVERAIAQHREVMALTPDHPAAAGTLTTALGNRAKHLAADGRPEEARELFEECIHNRLELARRQPRAPRLGADVLKSYFRAAAHLDRGMLSGAWTWLRSLSEETRAVYERSSRFVARRREILRALGGLWSDQGRPALARAVLERLVELHPDDARGVEMLAALRSRDR